MSTQQFALLWSNNASHTRSMTKHRVTLRGLGSGGDPCGGCGLTARHIHLDQVHIIFRPNADIGPSEFATGDDNAKTWRAETSHLFVRTMPGEQHLLFSSGTQDGVPGESTLTSPSTTREPTRSLVYSAALSLVPDVEGNEDYWCRTYRPVRDVPIANYVMNVSEMAIELMFPLLYNDSQVPLVDVPNYRILKVLCEFSVDR